MEAHVKANNCVFSPLETNFVFLKKKKKIDHSQNQLFL